MLGIILYSKLLWGKPVEILVGGNIEQDAR